MPGLLLDLAPPQQKPPIGARLQRSHPLCPDLCYYLFAEGTGLPVDLVHNVAATSSGSGLWTGGEGSPAIKTTGVNSAALTSAVSTALFNRATGTVAFRVSPDRVAGDGNRWLPAAVNLAGSPTLDFQHFTDNNWYIGWLNGTDYRITFADSSASLVKAVWCTYVYTWDQNANLQTVYRNGIQIGQRSGAFTPTDPGGALQFQYTNAGGDRLSWYYAKGTALTQAQVVALTAQPFSFLERPTFWLLSFPGAAVQLAVPVSDVSAGGWTASTGSDLYAMMDETVADDSDYILSARAPANAEVKVRLGPLTDPSSSTGHVVRYRYYKDPDGGARGDLTVTLYAADGTTAIATQTHTDVAPGVVAGSFTLSGAEADAIPGADYSTGLVLGFRANAP